MDDAELLARVRADISSTRAHFNHAGMSLTPAPVQRRVLAHLDLEAEIGGYEAAAVAADELALVPTALARLLGAQPDEVVATESATRAWETVLWSMAETFDWRAPDRILVDQFTYATTHSSLTALTLARGVQVETVAARPDGTIDPDALGFALDDRTRLVAITHMPTHLGTVTDLTTIGPRLADRSVVYALDVSQTLGHIPLDVTSIGCDIAFAPGRKFLRAPRGTGVLFVRAALAEQLRPLVLPFGSIDLADPAPLTDRVHLTLPPAARRFDQFEYAVAARLGLGAAATYALDIGVDRIERTMVQRSQAVIDLLAAIPAVRLTGTLHDRAIVSFIVDGVDPAAIQVALSTHDVNVWVNPAGGAPLDAIARPVLPSVRVSPHYLTNDDDLDRLDRALRATLAAS